MNWSANASPRDASTAWANPARISVFSAADPKMSPTKSVDLKDGKLRVLPNPTPLAAGSVDTRELQSAGDLAALISGLSKMQALGLGVSRSAAASSWPPIQLVTKGRLASEPGAIARTKDEFVFQAGEPAVILFDRDGSDGETMTIDRALGVLRAVIPNFDSLAYVATHSSSSHIYDRATGEALRGAGNSHIYLVVRDGADIDRFKKTIEGRLWLAGFGRPFVDKSGGYHARAVFDMSVFQPERLVFEAPVLLHQSAKHLVQRKPDPTVREGQQLDTRALIDLTSDEQARVRELQERARASVVDRIKELRGDYDEKERSKLLERGVAPDRAERVLADLHQFILHDEDELYFEHKGGKAVTVAEVIAHPDDYDARALADPLEPDYGATYGRFCYDKAKLFWNDGQPTVHSFAHGGRTFRYRSSAATDFAYGLDDRPVFSVGVGDKHILMGQALPLLAQHPGMYKRGGALTRVLSARDADAASASEGGAVRHDPNQLLAVPVRQPWLEVELTRLARFEKMGAKGKPFRSEPPDWLPKALIAWGEYPGIRELRGITAAPVIRLDGSVMATAGYDAESGLLLCPNVRLAPMPEKPTKDDAVAALNELRTVFSQYSFADDFSISVCVSLVLTRLTRHLYPVAPLHLITAPTAGTGKTAAIAAASLIVDGTLPSMRAWPGDNEEARKAITACLQSSEAIVCFDNVPNGAVMKHPAVDKVLTDAFWNDRLLGTNIDVSLPNTVTWAATGNNVQPSQDTVRRVLHARIDPHAERPWEIQFAWTPGQYAVAHRAELLRAACIVVSAFLRAGGPQPTGIRPIGTFTGWAEIVRGALMWLAQPDPVASQDELVQVDPAREQLGDIHRALRGVFGNRSFRLSDVIAALEGGAEFPVDGDAARSLREIVKGAFPDGSPTTQRLGGYFRTHAGMLVNGFAIEKVKEQQGTALWRVAAPALS